jgi:ribonuclease Z
VGFEIRHIPLKAKEPEVIYDTKSFEVLAFPLNHGIETFGFLFREKKPQLNVWKHMLSRYEFTLTEIGTLKRGEDVVRENGEVIRCADAAYEPWVPRSFAYCSDTAPFPEEAEWVRGVDLLYHETTYLQEHEEMAAKRHHTTTLQAAQCALDAGVERLVIGHYTSRVRDISLFESECRTVFPETYAASDGSVFDIPLVKHE